MEDWVLETIRVHARPLLAMARRHSLCADDAQDAYQRSLEIMLRANGSFDRGSAAQWLHTVVRREAVVIRERRLREVTGVEVDPDDEPVVELAAAADEEAERMGRLALAAEALTRLAPNQMRALVLRAEGHSHEEIAGATGWSVRKVNRAISEGRRAFRARVVAIDSGAECARWSHTLAAVADGTASERQLGAVRPHLRNCSGCRATLRVYREAPASLAALVPAGALAVPDGHGAGWLGRIWDLVTDGGWHERATLSAAKLQTVTESVTVGKAGAVALSATALAGGGVVVAERHPASVEKPPRVAAPSLRARAAPPRAPASVRPVVSGTRSAARPASGPTRASSRAKRRGAAPRSLSVAVRSAPRMTASRRVAAGARAASEFVPERAQTAPSLSAAAAEPRPAVPHPAVSTPPSTPKPRPSHAAGEFSP
jgi:DNA-directed RNA polymerase specialized sigma24 family protein